MAALRRLTMATLNPNPKTLHASLFPPSFLISFRGIAYKLFVGGLSFHTTEDGLTRAFSECGQVVEAKIVMDRYLDRSKGYGFVTFASEDEAHKAVTQLNGKIMQNPAPVILDGKEILKKTADGLQQEIRTLLQKR